MKLDMGKAWRDAMAMVAANREVMLIVAGVFFFLPSLAAVLIIPEAQPPAGATEEQLTAFMGEFYADNAPIFIIMGLVQAIGSIALIALLRDSSRPTVGEALMTGLKGLLPYLGVQILIAFGAVLVMSVIIGVAVAGGLVSLAIILGVLAFMVFIYVMIKLSMVLPVIALEKQMNPITLIKRSWQLTKGSSLYLLLFFGLLVIAFLVIALIAGMIFGVLLALLGPGSTAYLIANGALSGLLSSLATMIAAAIMAAIHRQLAGPSTDQLGQTFE